MEVAGKQSVNDAKRANNHGDIMRILYEWDMIADMNGRLGEAKVESWICEDLDLSQSLLLAIQGIGGSGLEP